MRIVLPDSPGYDDARASYNKRIDARPAAICFCETSEDVASALRYSKSVGKQVRVRSNRHSYEGFSTGNDTVVIDIKAIQGIELSKDKTSVKVGAGNNLKAIYKKLWKDKLTIAGGSCTGVGVSGFTLGGGIGLSSRKMGLACDNVLELEIVNYSGEKLVVNPNSYPDLFWACCGAGAGDFGVVVSFVFKVHSVDTVAVYSLAWKNWPEVSVIKKISDVWFDLQKSDMKELMSFLRFGKTKNGQKTLSTYGQFFGSKEDLNNIMKPFFNFGDYDLTLQEMSYGESIDYWEWICHPQEWDTGHYLQEIFKATSLCFTNPLPISSVIVINDFLSQQANSSYVKLNSYGGAISDQPDDFNLLLPTNINGLINKVLQY